jgi:hypothetical protein
MDWTLCKDGKRGLFNVIDDARQNLYENGTKFDLRTEPKPADVYASIVYLSDRIVKLGEGFICCTSQLEKLIKMNERLDRAEKELEKIADTLDRLDAIEKKASDSLERCKACEKNVRCLKATIEEQN